jgi:sugar phosphate isomerase/epimerase
MEMEESMKLGINSYTYMWSIGVPGFDRYGRDRSADPGQGALTPLGLLEKARQFGLHLVQTGPNLGIERLSEAELAAFSRKAGEWGIELELGTLGLDSEHLAGQIELARRMGARLVRTVPQSPPASQQQNRLAVQGEYAVQAGLIPAAIEPLLPLLEETGIRLALENGGAPAADFRAALDRIGSPQVGVVLDMVNSLAVPEGWKEVTRQLAPHTMCVHYKDFTMRRAWHMMGFACDGAPAGKGMVETDWLFEQLRASPYDFNVIIELWTTEQETLAETRALEQAWAAESVAYLRQFIPG